MTSCLSSLQLIEDRKTLTKHLNGLKNKSRLTMTAAEREAIAVKTARLEAELKDRNIQVVNYFIS
jgi:hypothetical protein